MNYNVWLALKQSAVDILRPLMNDPEYDGQHIKAVRIFRRMADYRVTENLFKSPTIGGNQYRLFSLNFADVANGSKIRDALDYLEATYPSQVVVVGAWNWDGLQAGTRLNDEGEIVGTPVYPVHSQTVKFMPPIITYDSEGAIISTVAATELTDVNLIQGQAPRIW